MLYEVITRSLSICLMLATLLFSGWLYAAVELNDNVPETYIVKKGDTLWGISGMYLKKPWLWPQLWDANPQIDNPHLIYPGDELYLVWIDGVITSYSIHYTKLYEEASSRPSLWKYPRLASWVENPPRATVEKEWQMVV